MIGWASVKRGSPFSFLKRIGIAQEINIMNQGRKVEHILMYSKKSSSFWVSARPVIQVLFVLMVIFGSIISAYVPVQADTILTSPGWQYYRTIPIYGSSSGVQTNYQKLIRVYKGSENSTYVSTGENIAQYTSITNSANRACGVNYIAQTFTASCNVTAKKVWAKLYKLGTPVTSLACALRATSSGVPTGTNLCSGNITSSYISTVSDWYEFNMGVGTPVTAGTQYSIILYSDNATASYSNAIYWCNNVTNSPDTQETLCLSANSGSTWTSYSTSDFNFQVVATTTGAIPLAVYCNNHCTDNFSDIRFVASDNDTVLPCWIENSVYGSYADFWVKIASIPQMINLNEGTTINMLYGNPSAPSVSNGTNTFVQFDNFDSYASDNLTGQGGWTASAPGGLVTTAQYVSSPNSVEGLGSVTNWSIYRTLAATSNAYWTGYKVRKDASAGSYFILRGDGTRAEQSWSTAGGAIGFYDLNGAAITTSITPATATWYNVDIYNEKWYSDNCSTYVLNYNRTNSLTCQMRYTSTSSNKFSVQDFASGAGNNVYYDDFFVAKFAVSQPLWGVPSVEMSWTTPLTIQSVKVFTNYKQAGDWLIVVRYLNTYPPYYNTYDVTKLFALQLIDSGGTAKAQVPISGWGNRVGSIYLSTATALPLTYGGVYTVRLIGTFTGTPYTDYAIASADWMGSDLANLDNWCLASTSVFTTYYGADMTTYIINKGEVLNNVGSLIFIAGISDLASVRPNIFLSTFNNLTIPSAAPNTQALQSHYVWQRAIGPDAAALLTKLGTMLGGVSGDKVGSFFFFILWALIAAFVYPPGHTMAAVILDTPLIIWVFWVGFTNLAMLGIGLFIMIFVFLFQFILKQAG